MISLGHVVSLSVRFIIRFTRPRVLVHVRKETPEQREGIGCQTACLVGCLYMTTLVCGFLCADKENESSL